ncbi:CubicO group peptidase, beta-lactamase class C family [Prosthecobacter debontii]|uniref:CubicO group peptidase, beta-lactamase class C family n=1 Tax=Prosthecobacter debontii TaxID=48467 RepID=A0A1T4XXP8_9BACT|nr:serine hydrolase [Prosthecobacter debontii]SKA94349.1 CubicO group peptidase, beta-lactamase class C family [Prosthecobacter debontii]
MLTLSNLTYGADLPLPQVAAKVVSRLPAGGIVTGESLQGKVTYSGHAAPGGEAKDYHENVLFEIGSITKVFTGLLLAQAVVEGKVTLETPISKLLDPGLTFADPKIAAITLKQLSTHTSGLPRLPSNHGSGVRQDDPYVAYDMKLLIDYLSTAKLDGEGPFPCQYSNLGVGLLGSLLGRVYGLSWEEAVIQKICLPLGLKNTRMTFPTSSLPLAPPFEGKKPVSSWHFDAVAGAGALRSTAADLIAFGQAIAHADQTSLAQAFALAMQPQAVAPGGQIGLNLFIGKRDGAEVYHHNGGTGGYRSALQVIPAKDIVRVVLINNAEMDADGLIARTRQAGPRVMPAEGTLTPEQLPDYLGVYDLDREARFTVISHQNQLWCRLTGQAFLRLFPKKDAPNRFFYKAVDAEVQFTREAGEVTALTLFQNGRELTAKRTAQPVPAILLHTADELKPYTGTYHLMGLKPFEITLRGNTLFAKLAEQPPVPIFDLGNDRFEYDVVEASLTFSRNEKGEILGFTLLQNGLPVPAVRGK